MFECSKGFRKRWSGAVFEYVQRGSGSPPRAVRVRPRCGRLHSTVKDLRVISAASWEPAIGVSRVTHLM